MQPISKKQLTALAALLLGASLSWGCQRCDPQSQSQYPVVRRDPQPSPGSSDRVKRRLAPRDNGDPGMLEQMKRLVEEGSTPIGYLGKRAEGDQRFGPFEKRLRPVDDELFEGRDGAPAREALSEMEASYLLVSTLDPPVTPWPSKNRTTIHELLRDGVPPPGFQPLIISRAHILYELAATLEVTAEQRQGITRYVRARLGGDQEVEAPSVPDDELAQSPDGLVRVMVSLKLPGTECSRGRALRRRWGVSETLQAAIDEAIGEQRERWSETRERSRCTDQLPEQLSAAMDRLIVQVSVVHRMAVVLDRTQSRLYYLYELGREGAYLRRGDRVELLEPSRAIYRAIASAQHLVERVGRWNGLENDTWRDDDWELGRFETIAWIEPDPGEEPLEIYRGVPLVTAPMVTRDEVIEALVEGAHYLARNQTSEGEYRYIYKPLRRRGDRWTEDNNIVRHSLCPMVVAKANNLRPDERLARSAKRGIDYTLSHLRHTGDRCAISYQGRGASRPNVKMGTVAAMVMSILTLGRREPIEEYRDELTCLANQILAMQEESGQFVHYDVSLGHPYRGNHNTIYPGELMLALSMLYEWSGDHRYRAAFDRAMAYERDWFRETRQETTEDDIYDERRRVALISFEPWGIMAMNDMHRQTNDERYVEFAFELVQFMDGRFHWDYGRAQYADYLGGYFKTQLEAPAINSCGYTEGAAAAFAIALRSGQNVPERRLSLLLGLRFVLQLQYREDRSMYHLPDPETAHGGFRYNLTYSRVRNDYMYHALNALALAAVTLREEDYPPQSSFENVPEILEPAFVTE